MVQKAATSSSLQGTVVVSYVREAWIGRVDPSLRVTFDHLCQAHAPSCHMASATHSGLPFLPETQIVFELKYDRRVPLWVRDQIRACSVRPVRISKYAEGLIRHFQERKLQIC